MQYRAEIERIAPRHGLSVHLVRAVCLVESNGERYAFRPEPHYRYLWDVQHKRPFRRLTREEIGSVRAPVDFPCLAGSRDQEWTLQRASIGLMQVMGAAAREYGFQEPYLLQLTEPSYAIEFGCTVLADRLRWAGHDLHKALAAYNGGTGNWAAATPQAYAAKVLITLHELEALETPIP